MQTAQKPGQAVDPTEMRTASASNAMATTVATTVQEKKDPGTQLKERKPMRGRTDDKLKIFCGSANPALADDICAFLGIPRGQTHSMRFQDGERYVIIASKGGAPTHPAWYHNLVKHRDAEIEVGTEKFKVRATPIAKGPERDRLYDAHGANFAPFKDYPAKTKRVIPVVVLERIP